MSADIQGDVLTITFPTGEASKVRLPRGERGPPGRDGISIKGDKGDAGEKGEAGRDGRDSVVPGPAGPQGSVGFPGKTPVLRIGKVVAGEEPAAFLEGTPEEPVLHLVIPRGERGAVGAVGKDGKHGSHEFAEVVCLGNSPIFHESHWSRYVVADGNLMLPEFGEADFGRWICYKTFTEMTLYGLAEGAISLKKNESARLVVIPFQGKFVLSRFG